MPIRRVKGGWKWGSEGHVYRSRRGAERQAQAAYAAGYREERLAMGDLIEALQTRLDEYGLGRRHSAHRSGRVDKLARNLDKTGARASANWGTSASKIRAKQHLAARSRLARIKLKTRFKKKGPKRVTVTQFHPTAFGMATKKVER